MLILTPYSTAFAQDDWETDTTTESWYTYWGLGYAGGSYPDELQEIIDIQKMLLKFHIHRSHLIF